MEKAKSEIKTAHPFFELLGDKKLNKKLRKDLIKNAPPEFYSVLVQIIRHLINGSFFCLKNKEYCDKYKNALYLLALPSTTIKDKQKILETEDCEFIQILYTSFNKAIKNE